MVFDASRRLDASICKSLGPGLSIGSAYNISWGLVAPLAFPVLLDLALDFGGGADDDLGVSPVAVFFIRLNASSRVSVLKLSLGILISGCDGSIVHVAASCGGGGVAFIGCGVGDLAFIGDVLTFTFADAAWNVGYADVDADAASAGGGDVCFIFRFASAWDLQKFVICC